MQALLPHDLFSGIVSNTYNVYYELSELPLSLWLSLSLLSLSLLFFMSS